MKEYMLVVILRVYDIDMLHIQDGAGITIVFETLNTNGSSTGENCLTTTK